MPIKICTFHIFLSNFKGIWQFRCSVLCSGIESGPLLTEIGEHPPPIPPQLRVCIRLAGEGWGELFVEGWGVKGLRAGCGFGWEEWDWN